MNSYRDPQVVPMTLGASCLSRIIDTEHTKGFLPKVLILLVASWLITRVWAPISLSSKLELLIVIFVVCDIWRTKKSLLTRLPFLWVPLSFLVPLATFISIKMDQPGVEFSAIDFEIVPRLTLFIFVAWCLRYFKSPMRATLALFSISLFLSIAVNVDYQEELKSLEDGARVDFGFRNSQWASMFFGLLFVGLLVLRVYFFKSKSYAVSMSVAILLCVSIFLVTETRGVWIAVITLFSILLLREFVNSRTTDKTKWGSVIVFLVGSIILVSLGGDRIANRVNQEISAVSAYFAQDDIPLNSIGLRLRLWDGSLEWFGLRPLTGWGGEKRVEIISQIEGVKETSIRHFHNQILEFLLAYGVIGLTFLLVILVYPFYRAKTYGGEEKNYASLGLLFVFVSGLFESYLFFNEGVLILSIILAPLLSRVWCEPNDCLRIEQT